MNWYPNLTAYWKRCGHLDTDTDDVYLLDSIYWIAHGAQHQPVQNNDLSITPWLHCVKWEERKHHCHQQHHHQWAGWDGGPIDHQGWSPGPGANCDRLLTLTKHLRLPSFNFNTTPAPITSTLLKAYRHTDFPTTDEMLWQRIQSLQVGWSKSIKTFAGWSWLWLRQRLARKKWQKGLDLDLGCWWPHLRCNLHRQLYYQLFCQEKILLLLEKLAPDMYSYPAISTIDTKGFTTLTFSHIS